MAENAHSTTAPAAHPIPRASAPDTSDAGFRSVLRERHVPDRHLAPEANHRPAESRDLSPEREVIDLSKRLVAVLKREPDLVRKLDMLRLHALLPDRQATLEKVLHRTWRRIDRWTRRLSATRAPTTRAVGFKAAALIETAVVDGRREDAFDALAISLAHDAGHLHLEAASLPQAPYGNFAGYHEAILKAHADLEALPPGATDADADVFMDRWGAIDRMAMADRPRTFADAIGALLYARREFHQFHVEVHEHAQDDVCPGDRLVLHLLDGALQVLGRVVQEDMASTDLALAEARTATLAEVADLDFEPWPKGEGEPHTNAEWAGLVNPYLITCRVAWRLCQRPKVDLIKMVRGMPEEGLASAQNMAERLTEAENFFKGYADLLTNGWTRLASACAMVAREQGEPDAQRRPPPAPAERDPDRRAVAAYREWLHMESRLLGAEMYPEGGADADRFIPANTAATHYHFPLSNGASWRDLPQPASRAEAMCRVLGIDWTKDEPRDEHYLHFAAPAATETAAA